MRDLMRHTSGLAYAWENRDAEFREMALKSELLAQMPCVDEAAFVGAVAALPLAAQPGTAFRHGYSTDILGMIVARLDGMPLGQALKARIFDRLGMHETGFEVPAAEQARLASAHASDTAWQASVKGYGRAAALP